MNHFQPPAYVALSDVLLGTYDTDYNPYSSPVSYAEAAELGPAARQAVHGLGIEGVMANGPGRQRVEPDNDMPEQNQNPDDEAALQGPQAPQPPPQDWTVPLLTNEVMADLVERDYNPLWLRDAGLDLSVVSAGWTSRRALREFFTPVFKVGDVFRLPVILGGESVGKTAVVSFLLDPRVDQLLMIRVSGLQHSSR